MRLVEVTCVAVPLSWFLGAGLVVIVTGVGVWFVRGGVDL